jgi:hypothetical protein
MKMSIYFIKNYVRISKIPKKLKKTAKSYGKNILKKKL